MYTGTAEVNELEEKVLNLYKDVLKGKKRWPNGYWCTDDAKDKASICINYMYDIKNVESADIYRYIQSKGVSKSFFIRNKLGTMLTRVFNDDGIEAVKYVIPEVRQYFIDKEARLKKASELRERKNQFAAKAKEMYFDALFDDDISRKLIQEYVDILGCDINDIPKKISLDSINELNLSELLDRKYECSFFKLVDALYPSYFEPWDFCLEGHTGKRYSIYSNHLESTIYRQIEKDYWEDEDNRYRAVKSVIYKLKDKNRGLLQITYNDFVDAGLITLLSHHKVNRLIYPVLEEFLDNSIEPWHFKEEGTIEYWDKNKEKSVLAIKEVFNEKDISEENIINLTLQDFSDKKLKTMLKVHYDNKIYELANEMYEDKFKDSKWLFNDIPLHVFNNIDERRDAIEWLLERKGLSKDNAYKLKNEDFVDNKLEYLFNTIYKGSVYVALNDVYPCTYNDNTYNKFTDLPFERTYEDSFGSYERIRLTKDNDIYFQTELAKIFAPNPNSWVGRSKPVPFLNQWDSACEEFLKQIIIGGVSVYKYNVSSGSILEEKYPQCFKEILSDELNDSNEDDYEEALEKRLDLRFTANWNSYCDEFEKAYGVRYINRNSFTHEYHFKKFINFQWDSVMNVANVKSDSLFTIYSYMFDFFIDRNVFIDPRGIYMRLENDINPLWDRSNRYIDSSLDDDFVVNERHAQGHYTSIVRCGEVEMSRMLSEANNVDYVWVFPFDLSYNDNYEGDSQIEDGMEVYLINFKPGVASLIYSKYFSGYCNPVYGGY